jgi:hypothetical protein
MWLRVLPVEELVHFSICSLRSADALETLIQPEALWKAFLYELFERGSVRIAIEPAVPFS